MLGLQSLPILILRASVHKTSRSANKAFTWCSSGDDCLLSSKTSWGTHRLDGLLSMAMFKILPTVQEQTRPRDRARVRLTRVMDQKHSKEGPMRLVRRVIIRMDNHSQPNSMARKSNRSISIWDLSEPHCQTCHI
jgi:hypothetical protein